MITTSAKLRDAGKRLLWRGRLFDEVDVQYLCEQEPQQLAHERDVRAPLLRDRF
jgi:hypothetical protein